MIRKVTGFHPRYADAHPLTPRMIAISSGLYCPMGLAIGFIDREFLLMAWVLAGFLGIALYFTHDRRLPLVNTATVLFGTGVLGCLAGYVLGLS